MHPTPGLAGPEARDEAGGGGEGGARVALFEMQAACMGHIGCCIPRGI